MVVMVQVVSKVKRRSEEAREVLLNPEIVLTIESSWAMPGNYQEELMKLSIGA